MKNDSEPQKPKLKLSLPKKATPDQAVPLPQARSPKAESSAGGKASKPPRGSLASPNGRPEVVDPVEIKPSEEVFWEVFEMDNLGFPESQKPSSTEEGSAGQPFSQEDPLNAEPKPKASPGEASPPSMKRPAETPPTLQTLENADLSEFLFDKEEDKPSPAPGFGTQMLIGDSEDQISRGPGRLTPEDEPPKRPPPPLDAPIIPLKDEWATPPGDQTDPQTDDQDDFEFAASAEAGESAQSEQGKNTEDGTSEGSRLRGRRFWVSLGLVAAIAGATAFTLSITRESRQPEASQPARAVVSTPVAATPVSLAQSPAAPALIVETAVAPGAPETPASLQSLIDGFLISVAHPGGNRPRVVINEVTVPIGALLDPNTALRLVQIHEDPRTLVFEDGEGQLYTRTF